MGALSRRLFLRTRAVVLRLRLASMLERRSLPDLLSSLTPATPRGPEPLPAALEALSEAEALIERLRVVPDTCLYRSLARYALLRRAGHPARFVMAVQPNHTGIEGHAWVELGGAPIGEARDPGLAVTFSYPS